MKILFIIPCGHHVACGAVRVLQYLPYLNEANIEYRVINYHSELSMKLLKVEESITCDNSLLKNGMLFLLRFIRGYLNRFYGYYVFYKVAALASQYDAIFSQRVLFSHRLISKINKQKACKLIFDLDDAIFLEEPDSVKYMIENSWGVVAGSRYIQEYASSYNSNTVLVPSSVPIEKYNDLEDKTHSLSPVIIGWIGSSYTLQYLSLIFEPLQELVSEGYNIRLVIAGTWGAQGYAESTKGLNVVDIPFYDAEQIPQIVHAIDIGIMPLFDTPWETGKCAMKALIYMAGAKPVVSSPVGEVTEIIEDGVNGYFAATTAEWKDKLSHLIGDIELRRTIGLRGRKTVEGKYSTAKCFAKLNADMLQKLTMHNE